VKPANQEIGAEEEFVREGLAVIRRPEGALSRAELIARLDDAEKKYAALLAEAARKDEAQRGELEVAAQKVVDLEGAVSKKSEEVGVLELKVKKALGL
jgi:hypothetical protein